MKLLILLLALQTSPEEAFGHKVGADEKLQRWDGIVDYFRTLAEASDRVVFEEKGRSTEGRPYVLVTVSSAENIRQRDAIKHMQRRLADPRGLGPVERKKLLADAPAVVLFVCTQHSTEVASTQTVTEMAYRLATGQDKETLEILKNTVVLIVPSANPDGVDKVVDWYEKTRGKPWEGTGMPWLYQKYVGHDNNRDWFMLTQVEQRIFSKILYEEWFPVITVDLHQMGSTGARLFVSPFIDPINPNIHPIINQQQLLIGGHVVTDLTMAGKKGVVHKAIFDNWWHGDNSASAHRHNITGILTETASVRIASPLFIPKGRLGGSADRPQVNFPEPWPGGWWRLRDIVEYQLISNRSIMKLAARYRDRFNLNYLRMGLDAVETGKTEPPFAYVIPDATAAVRMLRALRRGGVEIDRATAAFTADGVAYPTGTYVVRMAQPYRAHIKDLMERQVYPDQRQYPGGPPARPYDVTGWTLPLQMNVRAVAVAEPFEAPLEAVAMPSFTPGTVTGRGRYAFVMDHTTNEGFIAVNRLLKAGSRLMAEDGKLYVFASRAAVEPLARELGVNFTALNRKPEAADVVEQKAPRLGLYQPWTASIDEGWTRWLLEQYAFPYKTLHNAEVRAGMLWKRYDAILIPSIGRRTIVRGRGKDTVPPEYVGGIGQEGIIQLQNFVEQGGTLICLDSSCALAMRDFGLGVRDIGREEKAKEFYCPGSIVRVRLDRKHPLSWGMPEEIAAFVNTPPVFAVGAPDAPKKDTDEKKAERKRLKRAAEKFKTTMVGTYPDSMILMSGWIKGAEAIGGKGALAEVEYGKGRIVLFGIRPQHRAQPHGTFRLLFNAIHRSAAVPAKLP